MKTRNGLKVIAALIVFLALGTTVRAATYYVVLGSFSNEPGASRFAASLSGLFPDASFTFDAERSLYYVYATRTDVYREAEDFRAVLAARNGFANCWIFVNFKHPETADMTASSARGIRLELYSGDMVILSPADSNISSVSKHRGRAKEPADWGAETPFTFVAKNRSGLVMPGKVSYMRGGQAASIFKTGDIASFGGQQRTITFLCEVPGYSPVVRVIDMRELGGTPGVSVNTDGVWEIAFALTRMKADDVSLLYHGLFYENAVVMYPSSKERLDMVASLMRADPGVRISINTYCNARDTREIRAVGKEGDVFDIKGWQLRSGSDKQFTSLRAECLRDYLVASGISRDRISVMGWGHLNMIVNGAESDQAINDRVEVKFITSDESADLYKQK
jgi:outer membrane protein OmpA-like peptidoglycan-associated protein